MDSTKKSKRFSRSLDTIQKIVESQLSKMSRTEADAAREKIHMIGANVRLAARGTFSKPSRSLASRL